MRMKGAIKGPIGPQRDISSIKVKTATINDDQIITSRNPSMIRLGS